MPSSTHARSSLSAVATLAMAMLANGCARHDAAAPAAAPAAAAPAAAPATIPAEVSVETSAPSADEGEAWAKAFVAAIDANDVAAANRLIDWDTLFEAATCDLGAPETVRQSFITGAKRGAIQSGFVSQLAAAVQRGGDVTAVRCRNDKGQCRVLLRVIEDTGMNYQDMQLVKRGGEVRAVDVYGYGSGENTSASLRRFFLMLMAQESRPLVEKLMGIDGEFVRHLDTVRELFAAATSGDHARTLDVYRRLPKSLQKEKSILLLRASAAAQTDEREHAKAIEELRREFPGDPCLGLLDIDYHLLRQEHDDALAAIERVDVSVGGDPYLDAQRAATYLAKGDFDQATAAVERAIEACPDLLQLYWIRVAIALEAGRHADTAAWLDTIISRFRVELTDIEAAPEYAGFVASPEYREWKARRGG